MTDASPNLSAKNAALRGVHRSVLALLVVCACAALWTAPAEIDPADAAGPPQLRYLAAALAVGAIVTRRRRAGAVVNVSSYLGLSVASLLFAGAVGVVGVAVAASGGARGTALLYVLAGAIFALRPPAPFSLEAPEAP
jgi:hypothetical protein